MRALITLAMLCLAGCTANDDIHAPAISGVNPARASAGTSVVLSGSWFCQQPEPHGGDDVDPLACAHVGVVQFDASPVSPTQYTDSSITVEVPNRLPGSFAVRVSVNGRTSNSVDFTLE